jgi:hypothetical protein
VVLLRLFKWFAERRREKKFREWCRSTAVGIEVICGERERIDRWYRGGQLDEIAYTVSIKTLILYFAERDTEEYCKAVASAIKSYRDEHELRRELEKMKTVGFTDSEIEAVMQSADPVRECKEMLIHKLIKEFKTVCPSILEKGVEVPTCS